MTPHLHLAASRDDSELGRVQRQLAQAQLALTLCRLDLAKARHAARTDALAGLPNRSGLTTEARRTSAIWA